MKIGIGFSKDINVEKAAQEAAFQSKTNLGEDRIDLALIFSTIHYNPKQTLPVFQKILHKTRIVGCSTAGIILSESIETRGIAVLTVTSDNDSIGTGAVHNISEENLEEKGSSLAQNCLADFGQHARHLFLTFFDGNLTNIPALIHGAQNIFGNVFPIAGAGSCDDFHFTDTFQIFQNKILQHSAIGIIFGGHMGAGIGSRHGWKPLGKPRTITKSTKNVINLIDGKKAALLYEEFFGQSFQGIDLSRLGRAAILYPLGLYLDGCKEFLLRNAIDITEDGSIICQEDIPEGSEVHIMLGNKDSCKQAALEAAQEAKANLFGKKARLILVLESLARLKLLGKSALQEIDEIKRVFGDIVPIFGMYSNGEVSPLPSSEEESLRSLLHSQSIVVIAID